MLSFIKNVSRNKRRRAATLRRRLLLAACATAIVWGTLAALGTGSVSAQRRGTMAAASSSGPKIPATITLNPATVGAAYEVPLSDMLPSGVGLVEWTFLTPIDSEVKGAGNVDLKRPKGVRLEDDIRKVMEGNEEVTKKVGQKMVVEPLPEDFRDKEYTFEVKGVKKNAGAMPLELVLRFVLPVREFGVDEGKVQQLTQTVVAAHAPARPEPTATPAPPPFVLVKSTADEETLALTESLDWDKFKLVIKENPDDRANFIIEKADATPIIAGTIGTDASTPPGQLFQVGDYCVIHIIKWKPLKENKSDPEREMWALFEKIEPREIDGRRYEWLPHFAATDRGKTLADKRIYDTRIFGSKRVFVLPIHLNTPIGWDVKYKMTINEQVPTPIQNVLQLAKIIAGGGPLGGEKALGTPTVKNIWGARLMFFRYTSSGMVVKVNAINSDDGRQVIEQAKEYSKKYDNEKKYRWDVSVGLPANSIKELEYTVENNGTGSVVSVKKKERVNAYGFLNLFPVPVDLSSDSFLTKPHLVLGVPISGKPLDRPIVALGSGIYKDKFKINFFVGAAFNKVREPRTLQNGDAATSGQLESDLRTKREPKFVFGINFPIRQIKDALK